MRSRHAFFISLFLAMLPLIGGAQAVLGARGQQRPLAPDFSLEPYENGRQVSLSDVRGKVVLLYFFFPT
jgi:cytochrome oxidase Cu insertion factor (SCO1/SenC/PrrC family)